MKNRKFYLFVLNGKGIHQGLTWMYDAYKLGLVTRGKTVKIGDQSVGYIKDIVMEAHKGNDEFFEQFRAAVDSYQNGGNHSEEDENTEDGDISSDTD